MYLFHFLCHFLTFGHDAAKENSVFSTRDFDPVYYPLLLKRLQVNRSFHATGCEEQVDFVLSPPVQLSLHYVSLSTRMVSWLNKKTIMRKKFYTNFPRKDSMQAVKINIPVYLAELENHLSTTDEGRYATISVTTRDYGIISILPYHSLAALYSEQQYLTI